MKENSQFCSSREGFTLVEVLVATAVLAGLLALLLQISGLTLRMSRLLNAQMDSAQEARIVLDTISADLNNCIVTSNTPLFAMISSSNSQLLFVTRTRGPSSVADFRLMAVSYELANNKVLRRTAEITWPDADVARAALSVIPSTNASVLAEGVLRFDSTVVLNDGTVTQLSTGAGAAWTTTTWQGKSLPDQCVALLPPATTVMSGTNTLRVKALVVGVATLDPRSLRNISHLGVDPTSILPATSGSSTPVEAWSAVASGTASTTQKVPAALLSSLLISQQSYSF